MARSWYITGRVSTTVDESLLFPARRVRAGANDATLLDEALAALLRSHRAGEIDRPYSACEMHPLDQPDAWGDLASFREAAGES